eukprot:gene1864-1142_t
MELLLLSVFLYVVCCGVARGKTEDKPRLYEGMGIEERDGEKKQKKKFSPPHPLSAFFNVFFVVVVVVVLFCFVFFCLFGSVLTPQSVVQNA